MDNNWEQYNIGVYTQNDGMSTFRYRLGSDGCRLWHTIGYPAYESHSNGYIRWYLNDRSYDDVKEYCHGCGFDGENTIMWVLKYGDKLPFFKRNL